MKKMRLGLICLALGLSGMAGLSSNAAGSCGPPPQCFSNTDCNTVCGPEFGGTCVRINSCYRACACYG